MTNPEQLPSPEPSEILTKARETIEPIKNRLKEVKENLRNLDEELQIALKRKESTEEIKESIRKLTLEKQLLESQRYAIEEEAREKVQKNKKMNV